MNKVILIGRLTKDPETRYNNGANESFAVARYTLAVDREYKKDGEQQADFIRCVAFRQQGEFAEKYLHKGMKIAVLGHIQTGSYQNRDGNTVYTTDIVVERHEFCESRSQNSQGQQSQGQNQGQGGYDQNRSGNRNNGGGYNNQNQGYPQGGGYDVGDGFMNIPDGIDEDLPFN